MWMYRFPRTLLILVALVTLAAGSAVRSLTIAANLEGQLEGHPALAAHRQFQRDFGSTETLLADIPVGTIDRDALMRLLAVTQAVRRVAGVSAVSSLLDLLPRPCETEAELRATLTDGHVVDQLLESLEWYRSAIGILVSKDRASLGLLISMDRGRSISTEIQLDDLRAALRTGLDGSGSSSRPGSNPTLVGYAVLEEQVISLVRRTTRTVTPLAVCGGLLILWGCLGRLVLVLVASASVLTPLVWLLGAMSVAGSRLNSFSTILLPVVLTVALTTTLYVMTRYLDDDDLGVVERERRALSSVAVPQAVCTVTSCLGYLSLTFTGLPVLQQFGGWATMGSLASLVATFAIVPPAMRLIAHRPPPSVGRIDGLLGRLVDVVIRHPRFWMAAWTITLAVAVGGVARLHSTSGITQGLLVDDPIRVALDSHRRRFASPTLVELGIRFPHHRADHPRSLETLERLQHGLESIPGVEGSHSAADLVIDAGSRLSGRRLPTLGNQAAVELHSRWLRSGRPSDPLAGLISTDGTAARMIVRLASDEAFTVLHTVEQMRTVIGADHSGRDCFLTVAGPDHLSAVVHVQGIEGARLSLLGSVGAGILVLVIVFWSLRTALLCAIPNVAPLLLAYGAMGWTGRPYDVATGLVGPVVFGMIIDDTVHMVHGFRAELVRGVDPEQAYRTVIRHVGRAVVINGLTLTAGLGLSGFAPFEHARAFGACAAATVAVAPLCDLLLLPLLLWRFAAPVAPGPSSSMGPGHDTMTGAPARPPEAPVGSARQEKGSSP